MEIQSLFTCLSVDGYLGCLNFLAIANNAVVCKHLYLSFHVDSVFNSLGYTPRHRIAGSDGHSALYSGAAKLFSKAAVPLYNPTSNVLRVPISPYPCQALLLYLFDISHLVSVK